MIWDDRDAFRDDEGGVLRSVFERELGGGSRSVVNPFDASTIHRAVLVEERGRWLWWLRNSFDLSFQAPDDDERVDGRWKGEGGCGVCLFPSKASRVL